MITETTSDRIIFCGDSLIGQFKRRKRSKPHNHTRATRRTDFGERVERCITTTERLAPLWANSPRVAWVDINAGQHRVMSADERPPCGCSCHWPGRAEMHFMPCCPDKNVRRPTDEEAERFAREANEH